jgi:hypothetical protein
VMSTRGIVWVYVRCWLGSSMVGRPSCFD